MPTIVFYEPLCCRYFGDLVIAYLQDVLAASVMGFGHRAHSGGLIRSGSVLPPPMFPGNDGVAEPLCAHPGEGFAHLVSEHEVRVYCHPEVEELLSTACTLP